MNEIEREQALENRPQVVKERLVEEGQVSKLKRDDKLNYILSGRIREK